MEKRSIPQLDALFEYDIREERHEVKALMQDMLRAWGEDNRNNLKHLSYARMHWDFNRNRSSKPVISVEEYKFLDECMAKLLDVSPDMFELLKLKYIERRTLAWIGAHHLRLSQRSALRHVTLAHHIFYNIMAHCYGAEQRYTISAALLDDAVLEKVNYY